MSHTAKSLQHDLRGIVGNLKTIEFLLFSPTPTKDRERVQKTYQNLISKIDTIIEQMEAQTTHVPPTQYEGSAES